MAISVGKLRGSRGPGENADGLDGLDTEESEAFNAFYREFVPRVAGYVRRHIHDYELIDEIVQETLLRAYRHGLHLEEGDEHWRWLATVARNLCIDQRALHRNWRESNVEEPETLDLTVYDADPEAHAVAAERQEIVARALERLTERERRLLVLKHIEGRRVREMADLEGVHVEALKSALRRARTAFQESYAAVTERTGVASVFGPLVAGVSLRLREIKARIGAMGDQVTTLAAHATTSSGLLNTATTAAVVAGLALGPGLGVLGTDGPGGAAGDAHLPAEVNLGSSDDPSTPALTAATRAPSTDRGPTWAAGVMSRRSGGATTGDGGSEGGNHDAPDESPLTPPDPSEPEAPEPEPVDLGDDEVEDPDDATFKDFAYPSDSESSSTSGGSDDGDDSSSGGGDSDFDSSGGEDSAASAEQEEPAEGSQDTATTSASQSSADPSPEDSDKSNSPVHEAADPEHAARSDGPANDEPEQDEAEEPEPDAETPASEEPEAESSEGVEAAAYPEVFALGEPLPEKRGDCEIQCSVLFRSTDGGASWEKLPAKGLEADRIVVAPGYPDDPRIFAVGRMGLMVSRDAGHTFWPAATAISMGQSAAHGPPDIELWPGFGPGEDRVVIGRDQGAWVYHADTGAVRPLPTGLVLVRSVTAVTRPDRPDGVIVAGVSLRKGGRTAPGPDKVAVFCADLCEPWGPVHTTNSIEFVPDDEGGRIVSHTMSGVFRSDVHAQAWRPLDTTVDVRRLVASGDGTLFASSIEREKADSGGNRFTTLWHVSYDGGEHWTSLHRAEGSILYFVVLPGNRVIGADLRGGLLPV